MDKDRIYTVLNNWNFHLVVYFIQIISVQPIFIIYIFRSQPNLYYLEHQKVIYNILKIKRKNYELHSKTF